MTYTIIAHPGSKVPRIETGELMGKIVYHIYVREKALDGQANQAILQAFADFLSIKTYQLVIVRGHKSKTKTLMRTDSLES